MAKKVTFFKNDGTKNEVMATDAEADRIFEEEPAPDVDAVAINDPDVSVGRGTTATGN